MRGFFLNHNDHRARLRVRASGPKTTMELTFEIDTGATRDMLIHQSLANELGLAISRDDDIATLADGTTEVKVSLAELDIVWMGETKPVKVLVWPLTPGTAAPARNKNSIDGLIGRDLLCHTKLEIDYVNRKIVLTKPVIEGA
jgi:predicted aspartyl protease